MMFAVTSCNDAVVRHFSFERTHYVLKEGVNEADLQGAPWIDANIPGMVDKVEKPSLKDDFYTSVNYEMFVEGIPGPFDLSYEITHEKLNAIMNGGEYPNKDLFNQTRNLLSNGATAELKNYFDNFNVTKYVSGARGEYAATILEIDAYSEQIEAKLQLLQQVIKVRTIQ